MLQCSCSMSGNSIARLAAQTSAVRPCNSPYLQWSKSLLNLLQQSSVESGSIFFNSCGKVLLTYAYVAACNISFVLPSLVMFCRSLKLKSLQAQRRTLHRLTSLLVQQLVS